MSDVVASCPGCGDTLTFRNPATVTVVCPSCGSLCARSDVDLERIGKVAEIVPIDSPLTLGDHGRFRGAGWTAVGQLQLDHGAGPWNEWCLLLDAGGWAWLAEAQGELLWTTPVESVLAPPYDELEAGDTVDLGPKLGAWTIAEVGDAKVVSARGELPTRIEPGARVRYADLRGPGRGFATLDYGSGEEIERVYVGERVEAEDVGLDPTKVAEHVERRAKAMRLSCPKCGGEVQRFDPEGCPRVTCGSCGSLLDASSRTAKVIGVGAALAARPAIPLGAEGVLEGQKSRVLAFLVRSVHVEGVRYAWREYLLRTDRGAYRWLVESKGHWSVGDVVSVAGVRGAGLEREYSEKTFRHFTSGNARVDHVQGEVYWQVAVGETVRSEDYVAPPYMLTVEGTAKERTATLSHYLEPDAVAAAFGVPPVRLPTRIGVGAMQPNPYVGRLAVWWLSFLALGVAALVLMGMVTSHAKGESSGETTVGIVVLGILALPPIVASTRKGKFEVERWSESDHPMGGGFGSDDDDDDDEGDDEEEDDDDQEDEEEDDES